MGSLAHHLGRWLPILIIACGPPEPEPDPETDEEPASLVEYTEDREPCKDQNPARNAYFGDLHVHTAFSFDAWRYDLEAGPREAYDYAMGLPIQLPGPNGAQVITASIDRPLDFAAATDHAEYLAENAVCSDPSSPGYSHPYCVVYREADIAQNILGGILHMEEPVPSTLCEDAPEVCAQAFEAQWTEIQAAAEGAYDRTKRCRFTSFVGFEFTSVPNGYNQHRNVIFRNATVSAPVSALVDRTERALWRRLREECIEAGTGCDVLAIRHSSNRASGSANLLPEDLQQDDLLAWADDRRTVEPLFEVFQHKGNAECTAAFSADEECGFMAPVDPTCEEDPEERPCAAPNDSLRGALSAGLAAKEQLGIDPFQVGVIASTDTHSSLAGGVSEVGWPGHFASGEATVYQRLNSSRNRGPGGLAGVWAVENSRDALFDAMQRRETFGTSGPRIPIRLFAGYDLPMDACSSGDPVGIGDALGVPMGSDLPAQAGASPRLLIWAARDRNKLQQLQVVRVWLNEDGEREERVFEGVAGDPTAEATPIADGCAPSEVGFRSLCTVWEDPEPVEGPVAYYARALEVRSCSWQVYQCLQIPPEYRPPRCLIPEVIQERAWTSPVWVRD